MNDIKLGFENKKTFEIGLNIKKEFSIGLAGNNKTTQVVKDETKSTKKEVKISAPIEEKAVREEKKEVVKETKATPAPVVEEKKENNTAQETTPKVFSTEITSLAGKTEEEIKEYFKEIIPKISEMTSKGLSYLFKIAITQKDPEFIKYKEVIEKEFNNRRKNVK